MINSTEWHLLTYRTTSSTISWQIK